MRTKKTIISYPLFLAPSRLIFSPRAIMGTFNNRWKFRRKKLLQIFPVVSEANKDWSMKCFGLIASAMLPQAHHTT